MNEAKPIVALEQRVFLGFIVAVTLAMAWVLAPFFGAILWGLVASIVFWPVHRRIVAAMPRRRNTTATITLLIIVLTVILPMLAIGSLLIDQAIGVYQTLATRKFDLAKAFNDIQAALPDSLERLLDQNGYGSLREVQARLSSILTEGARLIAAQAVTLGQGAFNFAVALSAMLYLTFFLLRDGSGLTRRIGERIPLDNDVRRTLFEKFATVIRATVKGSMVVALLQGILGGITFAIIGVPAALLWGVVMGFLSLIPAVGTALVWVPFAAYLFATGQTWQGVVLVVSGLFVVGSVDNFVRPVLVGADTRMPDYIVFISTLGGISVMGFSGIVVGPVIAALFITAWDAFLEQRRDATEAALAAASEGSA
jgi:predicted PurR-regulated permease PerM